MRWLRRRGHAVLARNYRAAGGELDVVSLRGRSLYFVEVRTRSAGAWAAPEESVDAVKQARVVAAARSWLRLAPPHDQVFLAVAAVRPGLLGHRVDLLARAFDAGPAA